MEKNNNKTLVSWLLDILRGSVIGISNDIPGVSGGTMAVTMGIYDRIIYDVNNFRKNWRKALMDLLPILVGVLVGIFGFARILKPLIGDEGQVPPPITLMPTIFAFIGLILGGLPIIWKNVDFKKTTWKGGLLFVLFFALVVVLPLLQAGADRTITHSFGDILLLIPLGMLASATMVIPDGRAAALRPGPADRHRLYRQADELPVKEAQRPHLLGDPGPGGGFAHRPAVPEPRLL